MLTQGPGRRHAQRGLSIVEMMVGIAVGLFILAGTTKLFVDYLSNNRGLLLETRINQDLRSAADRVARDLRRAGYWRNSESGISSTLGVAPVDNPHRAVNRVSATEVNYTYAKDGDNVVDAGGSESFGVRRVVDTLTGKGVLELQSNGWNAITDPGTLDIPAGTAGLNITATTRVVPHFDECPCIFELTCTKGQFADPDPVTGVTGTLFATRPRLTIRQYLLNIRAQSSANPAIVREIREVVRVRNDLLEGACPA